MPRRLRVPAALAAILCLAGCKQIAKEGATPLKVEHASGKSFVPGQAERLVTLESEALDDSLALGVKPIASATTAPDRGLPSYLGRRAAGVRPLGLAWDLDLKTIARLHPDLILGSRQRQGSLYRELKSITATEKVKAGVVNVKAAGVDWKLNLRLYGEALQRPDAGERLLSDYDDRLVRVRSRIRPQRGATVSIVRTTRTGPTAYGRASFPGTIVADASLRRPVAQNTDYDSTSISPDQIPSLDADYILLSRAPGDGAAYRGLVRDPRWHALRAVRSGRVRRISDDAWMVGEGVLASHVALAELQRALAP